ncbi:hypothetical protein EYC84_004514 [Monilinia fructicola]|uniref:Uncharacterized protein n=1 Tax=Monilinia fructicola TaxID=38448 RepID=A0A5M9K5P3_MONFR|nr:hypothetical protein EYC84_004514 [Monilinia fructicola]
MGHSHIRKISNPSYHDSFSQPLLIFSSTHFLYSVHHTHFTHSLRAIHSFTFDSVDTDASVLSKHQLRLVPLCVFIRLLHNSP